MVCQPRTDNDATEGSFFLTCYTTQIAFDGNWSLNVMCCHVL